MALSFAVITPVRNEVDNLERLAASLAAQTAAPRRWIVVDNGSTDATLAAAEALAVTMPFVRVLEIGGAHGLVRGGPIVRAFHAGVEALDVGVDVVVKVDADVSFEPDYFARLLDVFERDPTLGMASGSAWEEEHGVWVQRHMTGLSVWGAARAYRRDCLDDVLPLEERMGWDGIDQLKANLRGWTTRTLTDLPFRHHRLEGERDGRRWRAWAAQGRASWFMGYRLPYLAVRALHQSRRELSALAMIGGFAVAAVRREGRCGDADVRDYLRSSQRIRDLPRRMREAVGRT